MCKRAYRPSFLVIFGLLVFASAPAHARSEAPKSSADTARHRAWVVEMKTAAKGPFSRIRWFCADGTVLPPKAYACGSHGGGIQHGEWNDRTLKLRRSGYRVGNVIAALDPQEFVGPDAQIDGLAQILLERFLRQADNGWIFRGALSYRGALQSEDEEKGAHDLVLAVLADPIWREPARYLLLREAARLLPLQSDTVSAAVVRRLAVEIADEDPGFRKLRVKIHGVPEAGDAADVRAHAAAKGVASVSAKYGELADAIDALYAPRGAPDALRALAAGTGDTNVAGVLRTGADQLEAAKTPRERLDGASYQLASLRDRFGKTDAPAAALTILLASLALEQDVYAVGNELVRTLSNTPRGEQLEWLAQGAQALYGAGLLSGRQLVGMRDSIARMNKGSRPSLETYRGELRYLARSPEWASQAMNFHFGSAVTRFSAIEPLAPLYPQDRLRGSPLLLVGAILDGLGKDANGLAGIEHQLFGQRVGAGLRALNPGLTRGVLYVPKGGELTARADPNGIYLLPETTSDLPPVSGILTRGEGSSLSHVQLLARNLGIPNVVVSDTLLPIVKKHAGEKVVLAVSPGGVVQLDADGDSWNTVFGTEQVESDVVIRPDLEKLDLQIVGFVPLSELRADDSGRLAGPKGANLGELKHHFGGAVPDGFVIPFGVFRAMLDRPLEPGGPAVFAWMRQQYAEIEKLHGQRPAQQAAVARFLTRLRTWIENTDPGPRFRGKLRATLENTFGKEGTYGVFVRSDTNVEDLPGFTGAGLNLTVPNVVGFENILTAVQQVWASPFTERAYGWRQAHMDSPEYVFPAVVVQYSFPADKSGVMVTADVDSGDPGWLSVAVSEGVGGAVDGQAAESLRIRTRNGEVRFLAQATSPRRTVLDPRGGIQHAAASGSDRVLDKQEIDQLIDLARTAPKEFPSLRNETGPPAPADIEFAFRRGRLALLQLRPFVESKRAQRSTYLSQLDGPSRARGKVAVPLSATPTGGPR